MLFKSKAGVQAIATRLGKYIPLNFIDYGNPKKVQGTGKVTEETFKSIGREFVPFATGIDELMTDLILPRGAPMIVTLEVGILFLFEP